MKHWCPFVPKDLIGDAAWLQHCKFAGPPHPTPARGSELETVELSHILKTGFIRQIFIDHQGCARLHARQWRDCKG